MEQTGKRFFANKVDVKGLSRKEASAKRRKEYLNWQKHIEIDDLIKSESNRNERNAWRVRSYLANKERQ